MSPRYSLLILLAVLVASCNPSIQFEEPMPPSRWNLSNIPKVFRGEIRDGNEVWFIGKDTVRIERRVDGELEGEQTLVNGEDFLLRKMAGHLVVNQPVPETGHWEIRLFRKQGDEMVMGEFEDDDPVLVRLATLLEKAPLKKKSPGTPGYKYTLLSPSSKEFKAMLKERLYEEGDAVPLPRGEVITP